MKKLMIATFLLVATSGVLFAQTTKPGNSKPGTNKSNPGYVDANKNNTCDKYENNTGSYSCNGQMKGQRAGKGFGNRQCRSTMQCKGNGCGGKG